MTWARLISYPVITFKAPQHNACHRQRLARLTSLYSELYRSIFPLAFLYSIHFTIHTFAPSISYIFVMKCLLLVNDVSLQAQPFKLTNSTTLIFFVDLLCNKSHSELYTKSVTNRKSTGSCTIIPYQKPTTNNNSTSCHDVVQLVMLYNLLYSNYLLYSDCVVQTSTTNWS